MIHAFPKIFSLGESYIKAILDDPIEITEKIDGSQFAFGKIKDTLYLRSKGQPLFVAAPEKMFSIGISYVDSIQHQLPYNYIFYCEYLKTPKHNILAYERTPKNNLMLFGIYDFINGIFVSKHEKLIEFASILGIEAVPLLYEGKIDSHNLEIILEKDSILGGQKIEGFVVKNYFKPFLLGGQPIPLMAGKFVSEAFKEKHKNNWKHENTGKGKWELFKLAHRTEARWLKSIQHLRDDGLIENAPRDIGKLICAIKQDIEIEEKDNIKEFLWNEFGDELLRTAIVGFPEFYKKYLLDNI